MLKYVLNADCSAREFFSVNNMGYPQPSLWITSLTQALCSGRGSSSALEFFSVRFVVLAPPRREFFSVHGVAPAPSLRECRAGLSDFIAADAPVAVTRHGQTVGIFISIHSKPAEADIAAMKMATAKMERLLAAKSISVDALVEEFKAARKAGNAAKRAARTQA